jgi:hypothetical protein
VKLILSFATLVGAVSFLLSAWAATSFSYL